MVLPLTHFRGSHPVLVVRLALLGLADRRDPRHEVGNADVRRPKKSPKIGQLDLKVNHFFFKPRIPGNGDAFREEDFR